VLPSFFSRASAFSWMLMLMHCHHLLFENQFTGALPMVLATNLPTLE